MLTSLINAAMSAFEPDRDPQTLNAAFDVSSGNVEGAIGNRRTEVDFVTVLDQLLAFASPQIAWRIVYDKVASFFDVAPA